MAYKLKSIRYQGRECHILLQNENGPCPLLAAANCLLLQGRIALPPAAIRNNVASLEDLTNVLANVALERNSADSGDAATEHSFHMNELLEHIPALQYGMDVNPKFTAGIHGYEFTAQLHCFDTWGVPVCHGWLLDPHETSEDLFAAIGQKTYNEIIELVIQGHEAETALAALRTEIRALEATAVPMDLLDDATPTSNAEQAGTDHAKLAALRAKQKDLQHKATIGTWIDHFLHESCNQLTQYGLHQIHQDLPEKSMAVFFRNNHFSTITKQDGLLYLLVTDLGYANTPQIVWEKLDMINGDTEHVNSTFKTVGQVSQENAVGSTLSPEALLAQSGQKDADYHLALHLSMNPNGGASGAGGANDLDAREGELVAAATEASLREYHGVATPLAAPGGNAQIAVGVPLGGGGPSSGGTRVALPPKPGTSATAAATDPDHLLAMQLSAGDGGYDDMASLRLAQQLQAEENQRADATRRRPGTTNTRGRAAQSTSSSGGCAIM